MADAALQRPRPKRDWRATFSRWQPYGSLILLCLFYSVLPTSAFFILALIHWSALDTIRTRKPVHLDLQLASQVTSIENKHRFCGDEITVTNSQIYRIGGRHYLVQVSRAERDLEGRELA
ncbi:hypothetical protein [Sphingomonas sp.]|uniref:hypothetical protein n=1 Tax=Sphingomonas sp. TaxID=28214 RepID=UPI003F720C20